MCCSCGEIKRNLIVISAKKLCYRDEIEGRFTQILIFFKSTLLKKLKNLTMFLKHCLSLTLLLSISISVLMGFEVDDYDINEVVTQLKSPTYVTSTTAAPDNYEVPDYSLLYDEQFLDEIGKIFFFSFFG